MNTNTSGKYTAFPLAHEAQIDRGDVIQLRRIDDNIVGATIMRDNKVLPWVDQLTDNPFSEFEFDFSQYGEAPTDFSTQALAVAALQVHHNQSLGLRSIYADQPTIRCYKVIAARLGQAHRPNQQTAANTATRRCRG